MPYLDINGKRVFAATSGAGDNVVICLHGTAGHSAHWRYLAESHGDEICLVAPDLMGHGRSIPAGEAAPGLDADVEIVTTLCQRMAGRSIHLVGYAYGGAVALKAATQVELSSLTLIEPSAFWMLASHHPEDRKLLHDIEWLRRQFTRADADSAMAAYVDYWHGEGTWARLEEKKRSHLQRYAAIVASHLREVLAEQVAYTERRRIDAPTLLIQSEHALAPSVRVIEKLFRELPVCQVRIVDKASRGALRGQGSHARRVNQFIRQHCLNNHICAMPPLAASA